METLGLELIVITTVMEPKVIISDLKNQTDKIVRLKLKQLPFLHATFMNKKPTSSLWHACNLPRTNHADQGLCCLDTSVSVYSLRKGIAACCIHLIWWYFQPIVSKERCFSSCHERGTKKKFWVPTRNRTSDLRFRAAMLYHWATETPRWVRFIKKFIWHASCILLGSAMSIE